MKNSRVILWAATAAFAASAAVAQPAGGGTGPGAGAGPMMGAGPSASAPGMGIGPGRGRGAARWGSDYTPGWALMTQKERAEHREHMRSMKTYEECKAYQEEHHAQMAARAKERGGQALPQPRRDACAALKP